MKKLILTLLATLTLIFSTTVVAVTPASAFIGCADSWEYQQIHSGMSRNKVKQIFGVDQGWIYYYNRAGDIQTEVLSYVPCSVTFLSSYVRVYYQKTPENGYYAVFWKDADFQ